MSHFHSPPSSQPDSVRVMLMLSFHRHLGLPNVPLLPPPFCFWKSVCMYCLSIRATFPDLSRNAFHYLDSYRWVNPLKPELNPICYLLALLGTHHFLHVSRIRVKLFTFRRLMSYIYGAPILDVSRSHTTTQHSR